MGKAPRQGLACRVVEELKEGSIMGEGSEDQTAPQSCKPLEALVRASILS